MQHIVIEKPYEFIPPHRGDRWPWLIQRFRLIDRWLRKSHGVVEYECRHIEQFRKSLDRGHSIMLAPNHCRPSDPIVMGFPAREAKTHVYAMASWHLYNQDWFTAFAIRKMGAFSVNREGIDRQAINTAVQILESAERPLIVFPEGATTRTNDQLHELLDGIAFIARTGAKKRARQQPPGKVVIHPVAVKYLFLGELKPAVEPVLSSMEERLTWQPAPDMPLLKRITRLGRALLSLKEMEYFGEQQSGPTVDRCQSLINRLLEPLEQRWLGSQKETGVVPRVKALRIAIVPDMVRDNISDSERQQRWKDLADIYLAQQLSCYPDNYLESPTTVDRILETIERLDEDLNDKARILGPLKVVVQIGSPIEVSPSRDRQAEVDPLMAELRQQLQAMMDQLAAESSVYAADGDL